MAYEHSDERSDIRALAGILRRRMWIVVVATLVGVGAALLFSHGQKKQYQSTAVLLFRPVYLDVQLTGVPLEVPSGDPTVESATDVGLLQQEDVRAGAAQQLGPPYTAASLKNDVNIAQQGKSDLVGVQATASSPTDAARIANAVALEYIRITTQQIVAEITSAQDRVRSQISTRGLQPTQRLTLRAALTKLSVLSALGPGNVHLVQPAVPPSSPSSPKPARNAVIGGLAGLIIGLAIALGAEQFDRRLRRPEEIEQETGLPLLATVPKSRALRRPLEPGKQLSARDSEPFRRIASNLRHLAAEREIRSVLITSPGPGSGKTTVALHLATAAASITNNVGLVEADLRRPRLSVMLGLPSEHGLTTVLRDEPDDEAIQSVELGSREEHTNGRTATATEKLAVLVAGPGSDNPTALLESDSMRDLIRSWRSTYEFTVVDGPPPGFVADAIPLAKEVDAVILVARLGRDTGQGLRRLRVELERLGIEPIGVVANFGPRVKNPYGRSKGYLYSRSKR
jgi:tyrosine-protein kinase